MDTVAAVQNEILVDSYSLSADYKLSSSLTLVGAPLVQNFSDSNQRWGGVVRLIYSPPQYEKFSVELKGRLLKSDFAGVGYFSPESLEEYLLIFGLAVPFNNDAWVVRRGLVRGCRWLKTMGVKGTQRMPIWVK